MASPGPLLCALGLLLCGAVNLGLFAPLVSNSEKPIIGKEAGRDPGPGGCRRWRLALRGSSECLQPGKYPTARLGRVPSCVEEPSQDAVWIVLKYS